MPSGDDFTCGVFAAWQHAEVAHERVARHEECVAVVATNDFRKGEEVEISALVQRHDDIALLGAEFEMVTASDYEIEGANSEIRRRGVGRHAHDAIERRLHRTGGDTEGLDKRRLHSSGNDDGHQKHLDILAKGTVFLRREGFSNRLIELGDGL